MRPLEPSLRLLREVRRIERIVRRFAEPADAEVVWAALGAAKSGDDEPMSWLDRLLGLRRHPSSRTMYGDVVHFRRAGFFSTAAVPFTGIALRGGGEAVAFRATVRADVAPVVLRFATERLFAAERLRFPDDLAQPAVFEVVRLLAFADDPTCRYRLPSGIVPSGESGRVAIEAVAPPAWRDDQVFLEWRPRHLAFRSDRFGLF